MCVGGGQEIKQCAEKKIQLRPHYKQLTKSCMLALYTPNVMLQLLT